MICGDCTACCTVCEVKAVDSPARSPCKHANKGCSIYKSRPSECEGFDCFYSGQPDLPEFLRPDNLGAMLEMPYGCDGTYYAHKVGKLNVPAFKNLTQKLDDIKIKVVLVD